MPAYHVLCTKKIAPPLVQEAAQQGIEIIEKEFIAITPLISEQKHREITDAVNSGAGYIVFTSANAAAIFCSYCAGYDLVLPPFLKVFCLAGKTRQSLTCLNEQDIAGMAVNADGLAQLIPEQEVQKLIFFCGNKRRNELPDKLRANGIEVNEVILYETIEVPFNTAEEKAYDGIMFFSPSAVSSFFSVNTIKAGTVCFAIGNTTAAAIRSHVQNRIITSDLPDEKIMMNSVKLYFQHN